jgi:hypothetical protein
MFSVPLVVRSGTQIFNSGSEAKERVAMSDLKG